MVNDSSPGMCPELLEPSYLADSYRKQLLYPAILTTTYTRTNLGVACEMEYIMYDW